ncbi:hypothetical protein JCM3775_005315 [Rhodotorula graminis]
MSGTQPSDDQTASSVPAFVPKLRKPGGEYRRDALGLDSAGAGPSGSITRSAGASEHVGGDEPEAFKPKKFSPKVEVAIGVVCVTLMLLRVWFWE